MSNPTDVKLNFPKHFLTDKIMASPTVKNPLLSWHFNLPKRKIYGKMLFTPCPPYTCLCRFECTLHPHLVFFDLYRQKIILFFLYPLTKEGKV